MLIVSDEVGGNFEVGYVVDTLLEVDKDVVEDVNDRGRETKQSSENM
jgi:hypothetical protein